MRNMERNETNKNNMFYLFYIGWGASPEVCPWIVESNKHARALSKTISSSTPEAVLNDVHHERFMALPSVDHLLMGPPCKGISRNGLRKGSADLRSHLGLRPLTFLREKEHEAGVMEQSSDLAMRSSFKDLWGMILGGFLSTRESVDVHVAILNSMNFNVPQDSISKRIRSASPFPQTTKQL